MAVVAAQEVAAYCNFDYEWELHDFAAAKEGQVSFAFVGGLVAPVDRNDDSKHSLTVLQPVVEEWEEPGIAEDETETVKDSLTQVVTMRKVPVEGSLAEVQRLLLLEVA
jgi:hypothetical protein